MKPRCITVIKTELCTCRKPSPKRAYTVIHSLVLRDMVYINAVVISPLVSQRASKEWSRLTEYTYILQTLAVQQHMFAILHSYTSLITSTIRGIPGTLVPSFGPFTCGACVILRCHSTSVSEGLKRKEGRRAERTTSVDHQDRCEVAISDRRR